MPFFLPNAVLEDYRAEIAWLRQQLQDARDHRKRLERRAADLPELEPQRKAPEPPMPDQLNRFIEMFQEPAIRESLRREAKKAHKDGMSWELITEKYTEAYPELIPTDE